MCFSKRKSKEERMKLLSRDQRRVRKAREVYESAELVEIEIRAMQSKYAIADRSATGFVANGEMGIRVVVSYSGLYSLIRIEITSGRAAYVPSLGTIRQAKRVFIGDDRVAVQFFPKHGKGGKDSSVRLWSWKDANQIIVPEEEWI